MLPADALAGQRVRVAWLVHGRRQRELRERGWKRSRGWRLRVDFGHGSVGRHLLLQRSVRVGLHQGQELGAGSDARKARLRLRVLLQRGGRREHLHDWLRREWIGLGNGCSCRVDLSECSFGSRQECVQVRRNSQLGNGRNNHNIWNCPHPRVRPPDCRLGLLGQFNQHERCNGLRQLNLGYVPKRRPLD